MRFLALLLGIFVLFSTFSLAVQERGQLTLLTVAKTEDGKLYGATANLKVFITPGYGNVYINSYPLSRIDTQESTRFANRIACSLSKVDCSNYDFYYTISADSSLIGGPSAGAAITTLTYLMLEDLPYRNDVVMTGTIMSGGIIGPVAGIEEKIMAAQQKGFSKVLVPWLDFIPNNRTTSYENLSLDKFNITVVKVKNIFEAIQEFTNNSVSFEFKPYKVPDYYFKTMSNIALELCNNFTMPSNSSEIKELENKAREAFNKSHYYSAASFCFRSGVLRKKAEYGNLSREEKLEVFKSLLSKYNELQSSLENVDRKYMSQFQAWLVVNERLDDASQIIKLIRNDSQNTEPFQINVSNFDLDPEKLAYLYMRLKSAEEWAKFFEVKDKPLVFDTEFLRKASMKKILGVNERLQYLNMISDHAFDNFKEEINKAYEYYSHEKYDLALFKASKAEAEINMVISSLHAGSDRIDELIALKRDAADLIIRMNQDIAFPWLGYSYLEYSSYFNESDSFTSLLYLEYAIEFSNLRQYFQSAKQKPSLSFFDNKYLLSIVALTLIAFFFGVIVGHAITSKE